MRGLLPLCLLFAAAPAARCADRQAPAGDSAAVSSREPWFVHQSAYFRALGVHEAWQYADGSGIRVGIIDTGFDYAHPDLAGRIRKAYAYPGAMHPSDMRTLAHGTFVASILGANPANGAGMSGLCPNCAMLGAEMGIIDHWPLKFRAEYLQKHPSAGKAEVDAEISRRPAEQKAFEKRWRGFVAASVAGSIRALADGGCRVMAMALMLAGLEGEDLARVEEAMAYAAKKDVVLVIGAGNEAKPVKDYPGDRSHTLVVGGLDKAGQRWEPPAGAAGRQKPGSNTGPGLDVMAPCQDVVVANPHDPASYKTAGGPRGAYEVKFTGQYEVYPQGGTSIAVPAAAALAALLRSARPDLRAPEILKIIRETAADMGEPGRDDATGWGRVDFKKALETALRLTRPHRMTGPSLRESAPPVRQRSR